MEKLISISKHGEPDIEILPEHLEEHIKLGWQVAKEEAEEVAEEVTGKKPKAAKAE